MKNISKSIYRLILLEIFIIQGATSSVVMSSSVDVKTIRGVVLDATTSLPISGALISSQGDESSVLSSDDGTYFIDVPSYVTSIEISAPSYNTVRKGLPSEGLEVNVFLYPEAFISDYAVGSNILDHKFLNRDLNRDLNFSSSVGIEEELQKGFGAGVHTIMRGGAPGIGGVMFINGLNSLNVNAQPLIVIDGVIFDQQYGREFLHAGFYNDLLSSINVADIESVTLMRNGCSLYGSKGSNGVLLIETRRCKSMATRITASISAGVTFEPKYYSMMDATGYKGYASDLLSTVNSSVSSFKFLNNDPSYYYYPQYNNNTDWKDFVYRTALTQNYGVNVSGGDDIASYNLSVGYVNDQSVLRYNDMDRLSIRFNSDISLSTKLKLSFDASFVNLTRDLRDDGAPQSYDESTPTSPSFLSYVKSPMLSPYAYANEVLSNSFLDTGDESYLDEALANYSGYNWRLSNPVSLNEYGEAENKNRFESSIFNVAICPEWSFGKGFSICERFSYTLINASEQYYIPLNGVPDYYVSSVGATRTNEVSSLFSKQNSIMSDTRFAWKFLKRGHNVDLFVGARFNWESYSVKEQLGYNTGNDKTPFMSASLLNAGISGSDDVWNAVSWYARGCYSFLNKYFIVANITADASSRFGDDASKIKVFDAPWALFGGVQLGWVLSNESWLAGIKGLDYLRFSLGYDVSGNDDIDYYASRSYLSSQMLLGSISGLALENIGNTRLKWETTSRFNAGFESNFFGNRLNLSFNYFYGITKDLLGLQVLGFLSGIDKSWTNGGRLRNQGFDASLTLKVLTLKNFGWEIGASVGHYKNEVLELPGGDNFIDTELYGATVRTQVGGACNLFYGYKALGVFSTSEEAESSGLYILDANGVDRHYFSAGDVKFLDVNGDNCINEDDRVFIGDPNPDIYGNIFTSFFWKRFRLDVNFNYSLGNDVYNYMRSQLEGGSRFMNQTTAMARRWQVEGQVTDIPRATFQDPMSNSRFSDRWIEDGSYLRLKSITLSYDLPIRSTFLQGFQFWIQGNNLLTFSRYLGSDPEFAYTSNVLGQGIDTGCLPLSRSIIAGIKINL